MGGGPGGGLFAVVRGAAVDFLPASLALRLGPLPLLGAASWAVLGYVLIFVNAPASSEASFFSYLAFLAILFAALGDRRWLCLLER